MKLFPQDLETITNVYICMYTFIYMYACTYTVCYTPTPFTL